MTRTPATSGTPGVTCEFVGMPSPDHYFATPGARSEKADTNAKWIAKRWR